MFVSNCLYSAKSLIYLKKLKPGSYLWSSIIKYPTAKAGSSKANLISFLLPSLPTRIKLLFLVAIPLIFLIFDSSVIKWLFPIIVKISEIILPSSILVAISLYIPFESKLTSIPTVLLYIPSKLGTAESFISFTFFCAVWFIIVFSSLYWVLVTEGFSTCLLPQPVNKTVIEITIASAIFLFIH